MPAASVGLTLCQVLTTHWPLRQLRLTTERLVLRLPTENELAELADLAAAGIHEPGERPFLTPWTDLEPAKRAQWVMQAHWSGLGSWSPDDWGLDLAVFRDGVPIGLVTLAAKQFAVLREVRSSSWFGLAHHGQGYGTEARTAPAPSLRGARSGGGHVGGLPGQPRLPGGLPQAGLPAGRDLARRAAWRGGGFGPVAAHSRQLATARSTGRRAGAVPELLRRRVNFPADRDWR
ncbi:GNAT family N-acetyltransferase [Kribbella sp. NPDC023855]|uniref:GNAT family N-acetyltransferase n=1 Tax=Kribbella sp. NPDC023855 TaxID=3154698 RepID=UPI0033FFB8C2